MTGNKKNKKKEENDRVVIEVSKDLKEELDKFYEKIKEALWDTEPKLGYYAISKIYMRKHGVYKKF